MDERYYVSLDELLEVLSLSEELERLDVYGDERDVTGFWNPVEAAKVMPVNGIS